MTGEPGVTLESLDWEWGDAYIISYASDQWAALRRDTHRFLTAATLDELATKIETDYAAFPVPRGCDPPGTADYLAPSDGEDPDSEDPDENEDEDEDEDEDAGRDGERPEVLIRLRETFPQWAISYAPFPRAWTARKDGTTICQNTAALLCVALILIERKERQARNGPGWIWPPWGHVPPS